MADRVTLLSHIDLRERGITTTIRGLWRAEKEGRFPKRVLHLGRVAWVESEIDEYLREVVARRG